MQSWKNAEQSLPQKVEMAVMKEEEAPATEGLETQAATLAVQTRKQAPSVTRKATDEAHRTKKSRPNIGGAAR